MDVHKQFLADMEVMAEQFRASGVHLELPPTSVLTLGTYFIRREAAKLLTARVPFNSQFCNPLKMYQGGFLAAAIDDVFGPLTYLAARRPVVTIEMSTSYLRPFTAADEFVEITAEVLSQTQSLLMLKAEVRSKSGKLVAISSQHAMIVSDAGLGRKAE